MIGIHSLTHSLTDNASTANASTITTGHNSTASNATGKWRIHTCALLPPPHPWLGSPQSHQEEGQTMYTGSSTLASTASANTTTTITN